MQYWTLFTLRMLARVGLVASVFGWAFRPSDAEGVTLQLLSQSIEVANTDSTVWFAMYRPPGMLGGAAPIGSKWIELPGFHLVWDEFEFVGLDISHSLLCLTFLIATVATHWPRKHQTPQQATEQ